MESGISVCEPGLLASEVVEPLLVGLGDVCQLVDELAEVGEPGGGVGESRGGLLFKVAVQSGEQFQRLCEGLEPLSLPVVGLGAVLAEVMFVALGL